MIADKVSLLIETGQTRRALTTAQALPDGSSCHARIATLIEWTRTATLGAVLTADGTQVAGGAAVPDGDLGVPGPVDRRRRSPDRRLG